MTVQSSTGGADRLMPETKLSGLASAPYSHADREPLDDAECALLNILEDFAADKAGLERGQRAILNVLDDFDVEKGRMEAAQRAVLNILDDSQIEREHLEANQRAVLNILDDFQIEQGNLEANQRSILNILDDFASEKNDLEAAKRSVLNILDDFSDEKSRLEEAQKAVLNILDDFEAEKIKVEDANQHLGKEIEERKRGEQEIQRVNNELVAANNELEAFSYSVAHDLRAPLRGIDGFSLALIEDYGDKLDEQAKAYLHNVRESAQHMARLIEDLLALARVGRGEIRKAPVDLGALMRVVAARVRKVDPDRHAEFVIEDGLLANGDRGLLGIVCDNLMGNAWKFTKARPCARIEFGANKEEGQTVFFIRDNGAGFDMAYSKKLFGVFQRLHGPSEFEGTGIGLATVQRIIRRHSGRIWATGEVEKGATFYFTLGETEKPA
jgi:signal transduction histidine kinase